MDIERMTVRVQKSLNDAYNEAVKHHNQQVDVIHLFSALVNQEDGLIPNIFQRLIYKRWTRNACYDGNWI